ncbi:hypothetical protein FHS89_001042 [Rubricella aquisinus]|uniref:Pyridoxamine 5'-phosphate oxidase N-terminal domain-containing protein n=1 Tax=Rubricella aquisinus TaxID=2028108 RepID=A0A840WMZ8_9RHOB|nr:pyridoxamine 5'-phosphate oxidase family protein [Rubricella aquisinus]MBB5515032.1 hypothetical protein [Rubricella aquisinus]
MTDLTAEVRASIEASVLCWLATMGEDGFPNVSPKEMFLAQGNSILIGNIASPRTRANILATPQVCVSFVDVFAQKGFKVKGVATLHVGGSDGFARLSPSLIDMAGPNFPLRDVIEVVPTHIAPIIAPSYTLVPDRPDDERRAMTYAAYGVRPA